MKTLTLKLFEGVKEHLPKQKQAKQAGKIPYLMLDKLIMRSEDGTVG